MQNAVHTKENQITKIMKKKKVNTIAKCPSCGTEFMQRRHWQMYCSERCRMAMWGLKKIQLLRLQAEFDKNKQQAKKEV